MNNLNPGSIKNYDLIGPVKGFASRNSRRTSYNLYVMHHWLSHRHQYKSFIPVDLFEQTLLQLFSQRLSSFTRSWVICWLRMTLLQCVGGITKNWQDVSWCPICQHCLQEAWWWWPVCRSCAASPLHLTADTLVEFRQSLGLSLGLSCTGAYKRPYKILMCAVHVVRQCHICTAYSRFTVTTLLLTASKFCHAYKNGNWKIVEINNHRVQMRVYKASFLGTDDYVNLNSAARSSACRAQSPPTGVHADGWGYC